MNFERKTLADGVPPAVLSFYEILLEEEDLDEEEISERYEEKYDSDIENLHKKLEEGRVDGPIGVREALDYGERLTRSAIDISKKIPEVPTVEEFAAENPHAMLRVRVEDDVDMKEAVLALREIDDDQKIWVFVGMDRKIAEEASSQGIKIDEKVVQDGPPGGAPGRGVSSGLYVAGHPYHAGWYAMRHRGNSRTTRPIKESGVVAIRVRKGDLKLPPETTGPGSSGNRFATENGEPIDTAEALVNAHYGCVIEHDIPAEDIVYIAPRRRSKNQMQQTPGEDQDWIMDGYSAITHPSTGDAKTYFLMGGRLRHDPNY